MRVLVTGATGAVGPAVVQQLIEAGHAVRALVRRPEAMSWPADVEAVAGDVTIPDDLAAPVAGCDAIVHLAALLHVASPPPALEAEYERVNVLGTANLLDASRAAGVGRFVLASTTAVYGPTSGRLATEDEPPRPDTWYSQSKLRAEQLVLAARCADGQPRGVVMRLSAVYGARIKGNYRRLVHELARGRFVPIGRGDNRRSLIHEHDAAAALVHAAVHPSAAGRVFNVANPAPHRVNEIIAAICAALGRRPPRPWVPVPAARLAAGLGDVIGSALRRPMPLTRASLAKYLEDSAVDASRLEQVLGYRAATTLEQGWARTIAGMRAAGELA